MPDESLEDFLTGKPIEVAEPPAFRPVRLTGEVEVLRPLVRSEALVKNEAPLDVAFVPQESPARAGWFSGFRSLAVAGSLAVAALLLTAAIFVGLYRPHADVASGPVDNAPKQQSNAIVPTPDQPDLTTSAITTDSPTVSEEPRAVRSVRTSAYAGFRRAVYRVRRALPAPRIVTTDFKPSTLVIYIQKGEIKTRIEPQLTSSYRPMSNR